MKRWLLLGVFALALVQCKKENVSAPLEDNSQEPWCGIADAVDHNQELIEKEGMITLRKHQAFERSWKINYKE